MNWTIIFFLAKNGGEIFKMKSYSILSKTLAVLLLLLGMLSAVAGIYMIITNGMGMPISWLAGSVFTSYLIPGLILTIILGGFNLTSGILLLLKKKFAIETTIATGFALLIWIFTEMYITHMTHWLQIAIYIIGIGILIIAMYLFKLSAKQSMGKPH